MEAVTLSEARVYVGTYNKYNNGSFFGKWLDLSDYSDKDEFLEACRELHEDEQDPEFMFQDYENIPEALFSESWLSEKFFELRDAVEDMDDTRQEAFLYGVTTKGTILRKTMPPTLEALLKMNIRVSITMKRILPTKLLKNATNCRSSPNLTSIMPSLPAIYFAATTGWRTVLCSGQLKIPIRAGTSTPRPQIPKQWTKNESVK